MIVAVFFVWVTNHPPIGVQSLQTFATRADCTAYVRPLLQQVAGFNAIRINGYCPTPLEARAGNYGEPIR